MCQIRQAARMQNPLHTRLDRPPGRELRFIRNFDDALVIRQTEMCSETFVHVANRITDVVTDLKIGCCNAQRVPVARWDESFENNATVHAELSEIAVSGRASEAEKSEKALHRGVFFAFFHPKILLGEKIAAVIS